MWSGGPINVVTVRTIEGKVPVEGGDVWYKVLGPDAKGIPLLVIHGGPGGCHDYLEPVGALANERPVIFYDQLGCGRSDRPAVEGLWTLARFVRELATVREALDLDEVFILAQSWGTMLLMEYLVTGDRPGIKGLVMSAPAINATRFETDARAWMALMPEDIRAAVWEAELTNDFTSANYQAAMMAFYHRHVCRMDPWPECLQRSFANFGTTTYLTMWGPSEFTVTGSLKGFDRSHDLASFDIPCLFTCGEFDEATPEATAQYAMMMPGSRLKVFEGCSHMHHLEREDQYLDTVRSFLSRCENLRQ